MEWVLLATQLAGFGFLLYLYTTVRAASAGEASRAAATGEEEPLRQTVADLVEQLRKTADEIARDLEDRSNWLQVLMAEADRKLEALELAANARAAPAQPAEGRVSADVRRQVIELAQQGLTSWEIAQRTKTGREEVELLLQIQERGG